MPDLATIANAIASGSLPPGVVYLHLSTPLGSAYIDPGAGGPNSTARQILDALGIEATIGFGEIPAAAANEPSLSSNLGLLGLLAAGALVVWLRPSVTTVALVGGGLLLWKSGVLNQLASGGLNGVALGRLVRP